MSGGESPDPQGARLWHSGHHTTSSQVVHAAILLVGSPNPVNPNMYGLYSSQAISVGGGKTQRAVRVPSDTARQWRTRGSRCITRQGTVTPPLRIHGIVLCTRCHGANGTRATQSDLSTQWGQHSTQHRRASTPTSIEAVLFHENGITATVKVPSPATGGSKVHDRRDSVRCLPDTYSQCQNSKNGSPTHLLWRTTTLKVMLPLAYYARGSMKSK